MPRLTRLLVVVFGLFLLSSAACFAGVGYKLVSAQEGDPEHPRAIVLVHGTYSSGGATWKEFIQWWSQPEQAVLRQMYAVYVLDYSAQDTTVPAPRTATAFVEQLRNANPVYLEGNGGTTVSVDTWLPFTGGKQPLNAFMLITGQVLLHRIWAGEVPPNATAPTAGSVDVRRLWGGYEDVILIGHSQGGLVAKELAIQSLNSADESNSIHVKQIIYLGTPHDGLPLTKLFKKTEGALTVVHSSVAPVLESARKIEPVLFISGPTQAIAAIGLAAETVEVERQYVADRATGFAAIQYMYDLNRADMVTTHHPDSKERTWQERNAIVGREKIEECVIRGIWTLRRGTLFEAVHSLFMAVSAAASGWWSDGVVSATSARGVNNGPLLGTQSGNAQVSSDRLVDIVVGNVTKMTLHEQLTVDPDVFARIRDFVTRNNTRYAIIKASWDMVIQKYAAQHEVASSEAIFRALWVWRAVDGHLSDAELTAKIGESLQGNSSVTSTPFPNRPSPTPSSIGLPVY